jgi:hypothetical protein
LTLDSSDLPRVAADIAMDGWRVRAVRWNLQHAPERVRSLFSLTDLLYLGGGRDLDVHAWGMSALTSMGCLCTALAPPGHHTALVGRPQLGLLPFVVPDLNLHVGLTLRELQMPVALTRRVLEAALHDLFAEIRPAHLDDWLTLVRAAQAISRERIEDYLAAVTASDDSLRVHRTTERLR